MKLPLSLFILFLCFNSISAQSWQQSPMHGGGYVCGIIPHPTDANTLFARIDIGGVYKTTNGGDNWTSITKDAIKDNQYNYYVRSFAIDATNTQKLYFLSGNSPYDHGAIDDETFLWSTTDGGANWSREVTPFGVGGNGLYRYAGETLVISPDNSNLLYTAGQPTYNYGTGDWNENSGLYSYNISSDTWIRLDGTTFSKSWITSIQFQPDDSDFLYISAVSYTFNSGTSTNAGLWKYQVSTGILTQIRTDEVFDFAFDAASSNTIITTQNAGIDITYDGGTNWSGLTRPDGYDYNYFVTAHPTESGHWFFGFWDAIFSSGIVETTDFGANYYDVKYNSGTNFSKVTYPTYANDNYQPSFGNATSTLLFHPANTSEAYVGDWYGIFKTINANTDLVSNTAATNTENSNWAWTWATSGIYNLVQLRISPHPEDTTIFYNCVADIGFYKGQNSGVDAVYQNTHPITSIYDVAFAPSNTDIGYLVGKHHTSKGRIVKTTDGGASWNEPSSNTQWGTSYFESNNSSAVTDVQVMDADANTLIVGIEKGSMANQVFISTDGAVTFSAWDDGLSSSFFKSWTAQDKLLKDANGETFYVWHEDEIYKRNRYDASWTAMTNPGGSSWFASVVTDPNDAGVLYATQYGNVIYKSTDSAATWSSIASGASRSTILAVSKWGNIAVLDGHHANSNKTQDLYVSENGGTTWINVGLTDFYSMVGGMVFLQERKLLAWSAHTGSAMIDLTTVLPVELQSFTGNCKNRQVDLQWRTVSEINVSHFEIQQHTNDGEWTNIGIIHARGYSNQPTYYDYTTTQTAMTNFYRLKMMDLDGSIEHSNVIAIDCLIKNQSVKVFPNPTRDLLNIQFDNDITTPVFEFINTLGQRYEVSNAILQNQSYQLNVAHLPKGIYFLRFMNDGNMEEVIKVIIE